MGGVLPFLVLLHMAGTALACLRSVMIFRIDPGQVTERSAAGYEQRSEEENDDWGLPKGKKVMTHW